MSCRQAHTRVSQRQNGTSKRRRTCQRHRSPPPDRASPHHHAPAPRARAAWNQTPESGYVAPLGRLPTLSVRISAVWPRVSEVTGRIGILPRRRRPPPQRTQRPRVSEGTSRSVESDLEAEAWRRQAKGRFFTSCLLGRLDPSPTHHSTPLFSRNRGGGAPQRLIFTVCSSTDGSLDSGSTD